MFRDLLGAGLAQQFIAALHAGRVCLHPSDTLPGLTFDPTSELGLKALLALKGRPETKPMLGLVASAALARRFFAPLPGDWERHLDELWPAPLSVVWTASAKAPRALVAADGSIGLRVPRLNAEAAWFYYVLERLELPLPTTSVNHSGQTPCLSYAEAAGFLGTQAHSYVPAWAEERLFHDELPSTVIRLHADGDYTVLRAGALPVEQLAELVQSGWPAPKAVN